MPTRRTSKRRAAVPARNLEAMGGPRRIDPASLAPLRGKIRSDRPPFDIRTFRERPYDPALRD